MAHHFIRLGMQPLQESNTSGRRWSWGGGGGGGVHRVLLRLSVINLRWRGGSPLRYPWSSLHGGPGESLMWCKRMPSWRLASGNHGSCVVAFCLWIQASTGKSWPSPDEESCARLCERATRSCAESFITPTISFNLEPVSSFSLSVISSLLFLHLLVGVGTWGTGILVGVSLIAALVATIIGLLIRLRNVQWTPWMFPFEMLCAPACKTFWDRRGL